MATALDLLGQVITESHDYPTATVTELVDRAVDQFKDWENGDHLRDWDAEYSDAPGAAIDLLDAYASFLAARPGDAALDLQARLEAFEDWYWQPANRPLGGFSDAADDSR